MANLFGLNIAGIIAAGFKGLLRPATLFKISAGTRTAGALTGGTQPTTVQYACEGFVDNTTAQPIEGTLSTIGGEFVSILGASLPAGVAPDKGDKVAVDGVTYTIVAIAERDPASALYKCAVEV